VKTVKEPKNQILCHEIEPNPSKDRAVHEGDNPSFRDEFIKFSCFFVFVFFFFDSFIHIFVFLSKYRSTYIWAVESSGDLKSTSIGLDPGVKCKEPKNQILCQSYLIKNTPK
jgi:hypothetical protein